MRSQQLHTSDHVLLRSRCVLRARFAMEIEVIPFASVENFLHFGFPSSLSMDPLFPAMGLTVPLMRDLAGFSAEFQLRSWVEETSFSVGT